MGGRKHSLFYIVKFCPIYPHILIFSGMLKVTVEEAKELCQPHGVPVHHTDSQPHGVPSYHTGSLTEEHVN